MIKRNLMQVAFLLAATLAGLGLTASATGNPPAMPALVEAGRTLDAALNDKVETLLRTDVGLAGSRFRVATSAGVVSVGGTVPDEHSLRRALDLVSEVRGVREVRNAMEVDLPKP